MKTGQFINYLAPFGTGHPSEHEATKLLDTADTLIKAGCKGVGITKKFSNQYIKNNN